MDAQSGMSELCCSAGMSEVLKNHSQLEAGLPR